MVTASHQNPTFMLIIKLGLQVATHITLMIRLWLQVTNHCDCSSTTVTAVVRLWPQDIKPQLLRARLHFPYSAQNMTHELAQIIKFLLSPSDSCQWPSVAVIRYHLLVPQQADGLRHLQFLGIWITPLFVVVQPV